VTPSPPAGDPTPHEDDADAVIDDRTVRSPRISDASEETVVSRRRSRVDPDETLRADTVTASVAGPRRRPSYPDDAEGGLDDGSTVVVRRESRRRAAARASAPEVEDDTRITRPATSSAPGAASGAESVARAASTPAAAGDRYEPRRAEPARATRAPLPDRARQSPVDTAAVEASARSGSRRVLVVTVLAGGVVVAGAVALLAVLLGGG
jgi:hypothetical protein